METSVERLIYTDAAFAPEQITAALRQQGQDVYLLDMARYCYLGFAPELNLTYLDGQLTVTNAAGQTTTQNGALQPYLEDILQAQQTERQADLPPFSGGLVGYFAYDYAKYQLPLPQQVANPLGLADAGLMLLTKVVAYDKQTQQVYLLRTVPVAQREQAQQELQQLKQLLQKLQQQQAHLPEPRLIEPLTARFSQAMYEKLIGQTVDHIYRGDIFQMILSNPLRGQLLGDLLPVYQQMTAPYHFYFSQADFQIAAASPETLLRQTGQHLATFPLAGTRRRGHDAAEDLALQQELQHDTKEIAEHNMLVDLGRNDLGQVSQFGSVAVTEHMVLKKFTKVMHLASTVESTAAAGVTALTALQAVFPAGTLAGAPKVSAMTLIAQMEQEKRGAYGGCFGFIDFDGDADFAIGIRLAHKKGTTVTVHAGAGIVADSIPAHEYQECFNKSRAVVQALAAATKQTEVLANAITHR
ncbi:anthranilate synthase component I family protein [Loigolactobacillus jiayinensis]|uniref:Anthranilate synthase component 1 n=1 Tax=Loigolactobacillus jiayinensis TaxID=2486016 RepID=A0ABW1RDE0_9LACO|nr:anthranilate synthase component I family protein [Loigolactobacillus jiayinensis]